MAYIKPTLTAEDFETSDNENFGKIVPTGMYTMTFGKHLTARRSAAGNCYLNIQLNHTDDLVGCRPAFATIMVSGKKINGKNSLKKWKIISF